MLNSSHSCTGIYISTCFSPRQGQKFTRLHEAKGRFSAAVSSLSLTHPDSALCLSVIPQLWHHSSWFFFCLFVLHTSVFRIAACQKSAIWCWRLHGRDLHTYGLRWRQEGAACGHQKSHSSAGLVGVDAILLCLQFSIWLAGSLSLSLSPSLALCTQATGCGKMINCCGGFLLSASGAVWISPFRIAP